MIWSAKRTARWQAELRFKGYRYPLKTACDFIQPTYTLIHSLSFCFIMSQTWVDYTQKQTSVLWVHPLSKTWLFYWSQNCLVLFISLDSLQSVINERSPIAQSFINNLRTNIIVIIPYRYLAFYNFARMCTNDTSQHPCEVGRTGVIFLLLVKRTRLRGEVRSHSW